MVHKKHKSPNKCNDKELMVQLKENLDFINTLVETIPSPVFYKDKNLIYRHCNNSFCEYLGIDKSEIIGHSVYDMNPQHLAEIYNAADGEIINIKGKQEYQTKVKYSDGTEHDVIISKAAVLDKNGDVEGIVGVINDITELKNYESRIKRLIKFKDALLEINNSIMEISSNNELFNIILDKLLNVMDHADIGCVLVCDENNILKVAAARGYHEEEASQCSFRLENSLYWKKTNGNIGKTMVINDIEELIKCFDLTKLPNNNMQIQIQSSLSTPIIIDGRLFCFINMDSRYNNIYDEADWSMMEYLRGQLTIAISKHLLFEKAKYLSRFDKLTEIYNRRYFEELFDFILNKAITCNERFQLAIFDLNGLKRINDSMGHLAGDALIKSFVNEFKANIRELDIIARYGGDEFIAIFFESNNHCIKSKLDKLNDYLMKNPFIYEGRQMVCSFSYGIAGFPEDAAKYDELVRLADQRMYQHKQAEKIYNTGKYR